ncbi:hypothetical protein B0H16DRAFT_1548635 [Mycena metata]|uniref:Uncharacterized protein n=1 Tax=Mycena metata TaxID=1033252 RepID=A0AAD7IV09_9AGAR|nr:hypothetical protein B0H16DRAFT_1548635 [Mycena metata]
MEMREGRKVVGREGTASESGEGWEDQCRTHFEIFAARALRGGDCRWLGDDADAAHRLGEVAGVNSVGPSASDFFFSHRLNILIVSCIHPTIIFLLYLGATLIMILVAPSTYIFCRSLSSRIFPSPSLTFSFFQRMPSAPTPAQRHLLSRTPPTSPDSNLSWRKIAVQTLDRNTT